ncbi:MAG TPA: hypothetical protein VJT13_18555 [Xanthobacteraceae bacterium]|nr:hypothetical protein [Xanthobacteraceae bacterium]
MDVDGPTKSSLPVLSPLPNVGLIVDVGRQRRKHIKRLKRGMGRIAKHVEAAADEARGELRIGPDTEIIPVVLLYDFADRDDAIAASES